VKIISEIAIISAYGLICPFSYLNGVECNEHVIVKRQVLAFRWIEAYFPLHSLKTLINSV
jgi:hypothetical protein